LPRAARACAALRRCVALATGACCSPHRRCWRTLLRFELESMATGLCRTEAVSASAVNRPALTPRVLLWYPPKRIRQRTRRSRTRSLRARCAWRTKSTCNSRAPCRGKACAHTGRPMRPAESHGALVDVWRSHRNALGRLSRADAHRSLRRPREWYCYRASPTVASRLAAPSHKGTRFWFLQCCKYWQWMATYGSGFACPGMLKMRSRVGRASDAWGVARQRSGGESSRWKLPLRARLAKANSGRNARLPTRNDDRAATSGRGASLASGSAHGLGCASTLRLYLC
jgi:hypothetical protein